MKQSMRLIAGLLTFVVVAGVATAQTNAKSNGPPKTGPSTGDLLKQFRVPADAREAAQAADVLEKSFAGARPPEAVRMLIAILRGAQLGPGEGWFGPAQSRYTWEWLAALHGIDAKQGAIARDKFAGPASLFAGLDRNKDGRITRDDLDWSDQNPWLQQSYMVNRFFRRMNTAGDGRLTRDELLKFFEKAAQGKEHMTSDDLRDALLSGLSSGFFPGDAPTRDMLIRGLFAGEIGSMNEGPAIDQAAPRFALKTVDGKQTIQFGALIGAKPVVLILGNFTCGPFRSIYPDIEAVYQRHKADATFLMVYVREAHPTDGWKMASNEKVGVAVMQPKTHEERSAVASQFCQRLKPTMPVVVDEINDPVGNAYSGMPGRLYVIDTNGTVAYKSGRGPFGFRVAEMEQALLMALLEQKLAKEKPAEAQKQSRSHVPLLDNAAAWKHLPTAEKGAGQPLPAWARATAEVLPRTTAAVLELDYLHRAGSPLPARLRGMMRWSAAHANRCAFTERQALADLRLAGVEDNVIDALTNDRTRLPHVEHAAVEFARKLTSAAYTVTDKEMAQLIATHGEKQVVAMVQLLAFANFQDRLILTLGVSGEEPLPPLELVFSGKTPGDAPPAPLRRPPSPPLGPEPASRITDPEWLALDFDELQKNLAGQRAREPRIRVPTWEEFVKEYPKPPPSPVRIKWSLVCSGYQPKLGQGWSACTRAFGEESRQSRVFEELQFWVVTRSLNCFY